MSPSCRVRRQLGIAKKCYFWAGYDEGMTLEERVQQLEDRVAKIESDSTQSDLLVDAFCEVLPDVHRAARAAASEVRNLPAQRRLAEALRTPAQ